LTIIDSRTSRVLVTAVLFAIGLGFLYAARRTLILFLFAIFFAYLINPAVVRLEQLLRSRVWAITVIYLLLLVALGQTAKEPYKMVAAHRTCSVGQRCTGQYTREKNAPRRLFNSRRGTGLTGSFRFGFSASDPNL